MGRIIIFTGKGGVGKTSVAAAHARYSALGGAKTLIVSTDMAHNLGDIFEVNFTKTIVSISENLDGLEIDPNYMMENEFSDMKQAIFKMINSSGLPLGDLADINVFPSMDELFSLLKILEIYESDVYERIIVDCAPTGETLALLKFPELLSWYIEKFLPVGKIALRVLSPISKSVFKIELPNNAAISDIERMFMRLVALQTLLKDRSVSSIRLVAMPEKMVVEETKRNYMYMNLYDFNVDGLYINRILPKDMHNPFFSEWMDIQHRYIEELEMVFSDIPIYRIPWFERDLNGLEGIDRIVEHVLNDRPVFELATSRVGEQYVKTDTGYDITINLPCIDKTDVDMHESKTDLIIKIGNFKRSIAKPNVLRNYQVRKATFEDRKLVISMELME